MTTGLPDDRAVLLPYKITQLSNGERLDKVVEQFYYLTKLHSSQTFSVFPGYKLLFYYLTKLHSSQTAPVLLPRSGKFYYLTKLHSSQTYTLGGDSFAMFYYLTELHSSQTVMRFVCANSEFYYLTKFHSSQTDNERVYLVEADALFPVRPDLEIAHIQIKLAPARYRYRPEAHSRPRRFSDVCS